MDVATLLFCLSGLLGLSTAFVCPEDGLFQHETRCDKYYWCVGGVPHVTGCPPGSFFSTITNFCNWPYAVSGCSEDGARTDVGGGDWHPQARPQPQPQPQPREEEQHLNSWEQDNNRWNRRNWDSFISKALKGAMKKAKSERKKREVKAVPFQFFNPCGGDDGYFAHEDDCTLYYWCINGVPRVQSCQGGLFFDSNIERCSWPATVRGCGDDGLRAAPF